MLTIVAVEYINTLPLLKDLKENAQDLDWQLKTAYPSKCAELYAKGEADIALVPVGALENMPMFRIISDFAIGCVGPVNTVALLSNQRVEVLDNIFLDHHSRTSSLLCKIFARYLWKKDYNFSSTDKGYAHIDKKNAGVVLIGDKVRKEERVFKYKYDFGKLWYDWQKLPFVFAVWVCRPELEQSIVDVFCEKLESGLNSFKASDLDGIEDPDYWMNYLKQNIHYPYGKREQEALNIFLELTNTLTYVH